MRPDVAPSLRDAGPGDVGALTAVLLRSRTEAMPWLISPHDQASTRWWVRHVLVADQRVRAAHDHGQLLGLSAVDGDWLTQLYVDPDHQDRGIGRALLDDAKRQRPDGLWLRVFTRNTAARSFYQAAGFVLVGHSDGSDNQEREPDCTYAWTPAPTSPAPAR